MAQAKTANPLLPAGRSPEMEVTPLHVGKPGATHKADYGGFLQWDIPTIIGFMSNSNGLVGIWGIPVRGNHQEYFDMA